MSFKPEVSTDGGRTFHQNALAFATREEAETSARDLMSHAAYLGAKKQYHPTSAR